MASGARPAPFARALRALALTLLMWQAVVAHAHQHLRPGGVASVALSTQGEARSTPAPHRPDDPLSCPICREVAHAGAYLAPGPIVLAAPARAALWSPPVALPVRHAGHPSHSWRSRAPPIPLHA